MRRFGFFTRKRCILVAAIFALLLLEACASPRQENQLPSDDVLTLLEVHQVDGHPLYVVQYDADYGFAEYLKTGNRPDGGLGYTSRNENWACTVFAALSPAGQPVMGRNFDWYDHPALLLFTSPVDGYASASMVDISYLGFDKQTPIDRQTLANLKPAPYFPFDGMNEKGLAVGLMAISEVQPVNDPDKITLSSLETIRLLLDYSATVDEALLLLEKYNIDFSGGPTVHFLIADAGGNSVVVEYGDSRKDQEYRYFFRNTNPWQVATNFEFSPNPPDGANSSCWRYNKTYQALSAAKGKLNQAEAMAILDAVSQPSTLWSATYNLESGQIELAIWQQFDEVKTFQLKMEH